MKALRYALFFFVVIDATIFLAFQIKPEILLSVLPQFDIESAGGAYPRLVGVLFLALGLARLYRPQVKSSLWTALPAVNSMTRGSGEVANLLSNSGQVS